jgi:hypothetical protein
LLKEQLLLNNCFRYFYSQPYKALNQTPKQLARNLIDKQLLACDWLIQHKNQINLKAGVGVAVRQYYSDIVHTEFALFAESNVKCLANCSCLIPKFCISKNHKK